MVVNTLESEVLASAKETAAAKKTQKRSYVAAISKQLKAAVPTYKRQTQLPTKQIKDKKVRFGLKKQQKLNEAATLGLAASEIILPYDDGFLQTEGLEKSYSLSQADILSNLEIAASKKIFELSLRYGPYKVDSSANGRHLLMGGKNGHFSLMDCHTYKALAEVNVQETIRDVKILMGYSMMAIAQKKYLYIYDHNGIELHCMRDNMMTYAIDFLPYHYLLVSVGEFGELIYDDISTGQVVAKHKTQRGPCNVMRQNSLNAIMHLGHSRGTVTLWTPNLSKPAVDILCHKGPVTALDTYKDYMVTAGVDGYWKVWDMRMYKCLNAFTYFGSPPSTVRVSQKGVLGIGFGPHVQLWNNLFTETKPKMPYLTHSYLGEQVESLCFRPFEDICFVGRTRGIGSLVVPGAGIANYDSLQADPHESARGRREKEIHRLLEKLQPDMITLDSHKIGMVDSAPKELINSERQQELAASSEETSKKKKNKMRGRGSVDAQKKVNQLKLAKKVREAAKLRQKQKLEAAKSVKATPSNLNDISVEDYNPLDRFRKPQNK